MKNLEFDFTDMQEDHESIDGFLKDIARSQTPVCLSGAARGSDTIWGRMTERSGGTAVHLSFDGHHRNLRHGDGEVIELSDDELAVGVPALRRTAKRIGRSLSPPWGVVGKLLRRNWWQVCHAVEVRAVAPIIGGEVQGGTGWAVDLARHEFGIPVHLFCAMEEKWFTALPGNDWKESEFPAYMPKGPWAGIGMRDLPQAGYAAIMAHEPMFRSYFTLEDSNPEVSLPSP